MNPISLACDDQAGGQAHPMPGDGWPHLMSLIIVKITSTKAIFVKSESLEKYVIYNTSYATESIITVFFHC